jgi:EmrB/QacA subfamily drug resistance transporter
MSTLTASTKERGSGPALSAGPSTVAVDKPRSQTERHGPPDAAAGPHPRRWRALAVLCTGLMLIALDTTVLNVALPTLADHLHSSSAGLQWVVDAYTLALGCLQLLFGGVADRIGRRRVLLIGLAVFATGSVFAAYSTSTGYLIAARAVTGAGGTLVFPCTLASVLYLFPDPGERRRALGLWSATIGLGVVIGPVIGGLLLDRFWFGAIFVMNVPIAVVAFILVLVALPESRGPVRAGRPDVQGAVLAVLGAGAILWGLIEGPTRGWQSAPVIAALTIGLVVVGGFIRWEHSTQRPLLPLPAYRQTGFRVGTTAITVVFFGVYGFLFVLTQDLQLRLGYGALAAGVRMLPAGVLVLFAGAAPMLVKWTSTRAVLVFGLATLAAGLGVIAVTAFRLGYWPVAVGLALTGAGIGLAMPTAEDAVLGALHPDDAGAGAGANSTHLQLGGSLGVALIGSLVVSTYRHHLTAVAHVRALPAAEVRAALPSLGAAEQALARLSNCARGPLFATAQWPGCARGPLFAAAARGFSDGLRTALTAGAVMCIVGAMVVVLLSTTGRSARPSG